MNVERLVPSPEAISALIAGWHFTPHRWTSQGSDGASKLLVGQLLALLARPDTTSLFTRSDDATGLAVLQRLAWDTRVLGFPCARIDLYLTGNYAEASSAADRLIESALEEARAAGTHHVSCRVDAADWASVHALERHGFINVDALITFQAAVERLPARGAPADVELRAAVSTDTTVLMDIAARVFRHGRFHSDPAIPGDRAGNVYREWTRGCCEGTAADIVLVATLAQDVAGFVACRMVADPAGHLPTRIGTIPLIAANDTCRRRGIGSALLAAARAWFAAQDAGAVEVGTQLSNGPAARLYERSGFHVGTGALSFRRIIET